jgi:hypothetical protein
MYTYIYVYIYMYIYIYINKYLYTYKHTHICIHTIGRLSCQMMNCPQSLSSLTNPWIPSIGMINNALDGNLCIYIYK